MEVSEWETEHSSSERKFFFFRNYSQVAGGFNIYMGAIENPTQTHEQKKNKKTSIRFYLIGRADQKRKRRMDERTKIKYKTTHTNAGFPY